MADNEVQHVAAGSTTTTQHGRVSRHHRSRKQQKPTNAEREQKKASRLQTLGPGESIKEKQVSNLIRRSRYTFDDCLEFENIILVTPWIAVPWCDRNVFIFCRLNLGIFGRLISFR